MTVFFSNIKTENIKSFSQGKIQFYPYIFKPNFSPMEKHSAFKYNLWLFLEERKIEVKQQNIVSAFTSIPSTVSLNM